MAAADTRRRILEAAIALMGRGGAEGLTASALAREVGVSKATLFHHFPRLDEVPVAALDRLTEMMLPPDIGQAATLEDFLRGFGAASFAVLESNPGLVQAYLGFLTKAMFDQRLRASLTAGLAESIRRLAGVLEPWTRDAAAADALARTMLSLMDGLMIYASLLGDASAQKATWDWAAKHLAKEYDHASSD